MVDIKAICAIFYLFLRKTGKHSGHSETFSTVNIWINGFLHGLNGTKTIFSNFSKRSIYSTKSVPRISFVHCLPRLLSFVTSSYWASLRLSPRAAHFSSLLTVCHVHNKILSSQQTRHPFLPYSPFLSRRAAGMSSQQPACRLTLPPANPIRLSNHVITNPLPHRESLGWWSSLQN